MRMKNKIATCKMIRGMPYFYDIKKWQELLELIDAEKSGTCANKSKIDLQHLYVLVGRLMYRVCTVFVVSWRGMRSSHEACIEGDWNFEVLRKMGLDGVESEKRRLRKPDWRDLGSSEKGRLLLGLCWGQITFLTPI